MTLDVVLLSYCRILGGGGVLMSEVALHRQHPARGNQRQDYSSVKSDFQQKPKNRGVLVTEAGSHFRLIDSCITQFKAQGPSRTCNESKEEEEGLLWYAPRHVNRFTEI